MKKLISMMLALCAIVTFTACSSDDDPTNPVTNQVVPASAKIGSEVTVQGKGFAAGQTLYLQPDVTSSVAPPEKVAGEAKMSATGATFTVPYTFNVGKVNVVLQNGDDFWTLGSINLLAADNPVSALDMPAEMALGKEIVIAGIGFADGDMIALEAGSESKPLPATVTSDGLQFTLPAEQAEGNYNVFLVRGANSWSLGEVYVYAERQIESITISENYMLTMYAGMLGLQDDFLKLNFSYNTDGTLNKITSNSELAWEFAYDGNTVTSTSPTSGRPFKYTFDEQGRIKSSLGYGVYGDELTYVWSYDSNGYLVNIKEMGAKDEDAIYTGTYTDGNMSAYSLSGMPNEFTTDKSVRVCPNTVEPFVLHSAFNFLIGPEDLAIGFFLNRNVKVSSYAPNKITVVEEESSTPIESSFADNALTIKTLGQLISGYQGLFTNTVVVNYKKK